MLIVEFLVCGMGVKQDIQKVFFWYLKVVDGGDLFVMFCYVFILMEGCFVKQDKVCVDEFMYKVVDVGNLLVVFNWVQIFVFQKLGEEGFCNVLFYYEKFVVKGIVDVEYVFLQIYLNLFDLLKEKCDSVKDWLQCVVKVGYDIVEFDMVIWLIDGIEFLCDQEVGFVWMYCVVFVGNVVVQNKFVYFFIQGIGMKQDIVEVGKWYVMFCWVGCEDKYFEDVFQGLMEQQQKVVIEVVNKQQWFICLC